MQALVADQFMATDRDRIERQEVEGGCQQQTDDGEHAGNHGFLGVQLFFKRQTDNQRHQQKKRPDDTVQNNLQGRDRPQRLPIERADPPD